MPFVHFSNTKLVYFAVVGTAEDFESKRVMRTFIVDTLWKKINDNVGLSDVYEHIVLQNDATSWEDWTLMVALRAAGSTQGRKASLLEDELI